MASGASQTQKELEKTNTTLTMLMAQANADAKFDPAPPPTITPSRIKEAFQSLRSLQDPEPAHALMVVAVLLLFYGFTK
jgi:hypothetical protein